jgi:hypothetical protein
MAALCAAALVLTLAGCGTSVAQFCNDARAVRTTLTSRLSNNIAPLGKSELTSLATQLRKLADEAPDQIKADLTTLGDFFDKASINGIDTVDAATRNAANAAGTRYSAWANQNCGSG